MCILVVLCFVASGLCGVIPDEDWGYVPVRRNANLFWWLYGMSDPTKRDSSPTIVWLQGGPGASSTGFGNFGEIGPLDVNLNPRPINWVQSANVLFIDSPVGTGFSYVTSNDAYCTTDEQIGIDLVALMKQLLFKYPILRSNPFWIFCESYGGKEATSFAVALANAIKQGEINMNLKGVALGDSWISPGDFVASYADYLYSVSEIDSNGQSKIQESALKVAKAIESQQWKEATQYWSENQIDILDATYNINFYNILYRKQGDLKYKKGSSLSEFVRKYLKNYHDDPLTTLMNGKIRQKLKIIPANVTWGGQSDNVFSYLSGVFMKPYITQVDSLISQNYNVNIYSGNLDLICCTTGTLTWMNKLQWPDYPKFDSSSRKPLVASDGTVLGFKKEFENLRFYTILAAGHMVPSDQPLAAKLMLDQVIL